MEQLRQIANPSWVFVSLGNDSRNLEASIKIREIYAQQNLRQQYMPMHYTISSHSPFIQTVIENDDTARLLNKNRLMNYRNEYYEIHAIGNISSLCSIDNLCNAELEDLALQAHLKWGDQATFNSPKQHNCLVKFDDLSRNEKKKDKLMNRSHTIHHAYHPDTTLHRFL